MGLRDVVERRDDLRKWKERGSGKNISINGEEVNMVGWKKYGTVSVKSCRSLVNVVWRVLPCMKWTPCFGGCGTPYRPKCCRLPEIPSPSQGSVTFPGSNEGSQVPMVGVEHISLFLDM